MHIFDFWVFCASETMPPASRAVPAAFWSQAWISELSAAFEWRDQASFDLRPEVHLFALLKSPCISDSVLQAAFHFCRNRWWCALLGSLVPYRWCLHMPMWALSELPDTWMSIHIRTCALIDYLYLWRSTSTIEKPITGSFFKMNLERRPIQT